MNRCEKVLLCCRNVWETHQEIAKRYDERFPPRWFEIFRKRWIAQDSSLPSTSVSLELGILHRRGVVERKSEEVWGTVKGKPYLFTRNWYRLKGNVPDKTEKETPASPAPMAT